LYSFAGNGGERVIRVDGNVHGSTCVGETAAVFAPAASLDRQCPAGADGGAACDAARCHGLRLGQAIDLNGELRCRSCARGAAFEYRLVAAAHQLSAPAVEVRKALGGVVERGHRRFDLAERRDFCLDAAGLGLQQTQRALLDLHQLADDRIDVQSTADAGRRNASHG